LRRIIVQMPTPRGSSGPRRGAAKKSSQSTGRPTGGQKRRSSGSRSRDDAARPGGPKRYGPSDGRPARSRDDRGRDDRPSRSRDDRSRDDRPARGRPAGARDDRPSRSRDDRSRDDRPARGRDDRPARGRDDRPARSRDDRSRRDEPRRSAPRQTDAQRRADEVKRRTGGRKYEAGAMPPAERFVERWEDEGSTSPRRKPTKKVEELREVTFSDERKASKAAQATVDSRALGALVAALGDKEGRKVATKLALALDAFERERWSDVKKIVLPLSRNITGVELLHELLGLAMYRLSQWLDAADHLEQARRLNPANAVNHPVLADCYRALKRYDKVDELWRELRESSPDAAIVAEGRIVAASSQADRGDLAGAVRTMEHAKKDPAVPREHHLREWYVLADLYDRSGDVGKARIIFRKIERVDAAFADVGRRLEELGS